MKLSNVVVEEKAVPGAGRSEWWSSQNGAVQQQEALRTDRTVEQDIGQCQFRIAQYICTDSKSSFSHQQDGFEVGLSSAAKSKSIPANGLKTPRHTDDVEM